MKTKRFLLAVLMMPFVFISCSSDDDDESNGGTNIKTDTSVKVETAGTLSLLLGDKVKTIKSLKITGSINGDDIICLRQMLRCTDEDSDMRGMLTTLDLSSATIVEGGDAYYKTYTTTNNVIGRNMFYNCESLETMSLPSGATEIGKNAFEGCLSLTEIVLNSALTSIGSYAFYDCRSLKSITIPNNVTEIGREAFRDCEVMTKVVLGSSVKTISSFAFAYLNIESVTSLNPTPPSCDTYTFHDASTSTCTLFVPKGSMDDYTSQYTWSLFGNIVELN